MDSVQRFEAAAALAKKLGYRVRHECLDGAGGGSCEVRGQKWIFIDLTLSPAEQLEQLLEVLEADSQVSMPADLAGRPVIRRAA